METSVERLETALVLPMWNHDDARLRAIVAGGMSDREVIGIEVDSGDRSLIYGGTRAGQVEPTTRLPRGDHLLMTVSPVLHDGDTIGKVTVVGTRALLEEQHCRRTWSRLRPPHRRQATAWQTRAGDEVQTWTA